MKPTWHPTEAALLSSFGSMLIHALKLNPTKAPGPEGWPLFCLKESAQELCIPLSILFNKSLECSILPSCWKEALITPVLKKGDRSHIGNY